MQDEFLEVGRVSQELSCSNFSVGANACGNHGRLASCGVKKPGNNCIFLWNRAVWSIEVDSPAESVRIISIKDAINAGREIRDELIAQELHIAHRPLVRTAANKNYGLPT